MTDPMIQIIAYMFATLVLGLILGWLFWGYGYAKRFRLMCTEADYWKNRFDQSRLEQQVDVLTIEGIKKTSSDDVS